MLLVFPVRKLSETWIKNVRIKQILKEAKFVKFNSHNKIQQIPRTWPISRKCLNTQTRSWSCQITALLSTYCYHGNPVNKKSPSGKNWPIFTEKLKIKTSKTGHHKIQIFDKVFCQFPIVKKLLSFKRNLFHFSVFIGSNLRCCFKNNYSPSNLRWIWWSPRGYVVYSSQLEF